MEVPAQEPEQRSGQGEAQDGDERLPDLRRQADEPRVTAAMKATPDDSPSRPSIQLMLLIIPTIQKIVRPGRDRPGEADHARAERVGDEVDA